MSETLLAGASFSAYDRRLRFVLDHVLEHVPEAAEWHILDLGCGSGEATAELAARRPRCTFTGIDISASSVQAARERGAEGATFVVGDYLELERGPFDAILADGVLHLLPGATPDVVARLRDDVRPGGLLFAVMPFVSAYNRALTLVRRGLRAIRSRPVDRASLAIARRLHGGEMSDAQLRERLVYNYVVPARLGGGAFDSAMAAAGFDVLAAYPMEQASPAQLRHRMTVYRRRERP